MFSFRIIPGLANVHYIVSTNNRIDGQPGIKPHPKILGHTLADPTWGQRCRGLWLAQEAARQRLRDARLGA